MFAGTWVLFISLFLMILGNGLQGSLLGIRGADEGFSTLILSLISTGYYLGFFIGSMIIPVFIKRVGYVRVFAALVAVASVAAIAYAMFVQQYVWFVMRIITGFSIAGIIIIAESWLNSQTHNDNRAKVLAVYVIVMFLGMAFGQVLLNIGDIGGYFLFALASVVISLASVPLLLTNRPIPVIEEAASMSVLKLCKRSPLGTVASFFANFLNGGILGMSVIYAKITHMSTEKIALFVASAFIGVILLQFPIGYLSDRMDRRKMVIILCALSAVVTLLAMRTDTTDYLIVLFAILGGLALPLYAVCIAFVNDRLKPEEILPATSALMKISGMGNMLAPILIGYVMVKYGAEWFFGTLGIAAVIVVIFGIYRMMMGKDVDLDDMADFSPIGVAATQTTMSLAYEGTQLAFDFDQTPADKIVNTHTAKDDNPTDK